MRKLFKAVGIVIFIIILIFIVIGVIVVKNFSKANVEKVDMYVGIRLQLNKFFNPDSNGDKSIQEIRENLDKTFLKFSNRPIPFSNINNMTLEINNDKIPVRIYTPKEGEILPIIIYLHGGSWFSGNLEVYDNLCRKLSKNTNAIVISVAYRLAPENPFPDGLNDVYNTLKWTYENAENINGDKKRIAIAGDSAGGNLSAAVSLMARDQKGPRITCQVLMYPATNPSDLTSQSWHNFSNAFNVSNKDMEKYISLYVPEKEDRKNQYVSPLLAKDFRGLPDTLVVTVEIDPLYDEGEAYASKLKEAGNEVNIISVSGIPHGFITMDKITHKADETLNQVSVYIKNEFEKYK
jgi:acetyl esterase